MTIRLTDYILAFEASVLAPWKDAAPWALTAHAEQIVASLLEGVNEGWIAAGVSVHPTATVEAGAILKGPAIIGPGCYVAAGAYVRGGCWLDANCILGPGAELKSSFMFAGSKLAHFNFVGDSVLGEGVNLEAGAVIANYRNELADKQIRFQFDGATLSTGVDKFGALVGDGARIGANAVVAPGAVVARQSLVPRLTLVDQR